MHTALSRSSLLVDDAIGLPSTPPVARRTSRGTAVRGSSTTSGVAHGIATSTSGEGRDRLRSVAFRAVERGRGA